MNSFAAIASLLAASAFASTVNADGQRHVEKAPPALVNSASRPLKNVGEAAETRQKQARKRSLRAVNEHSEPDFNAVSAT